jgi:DNA modification methylase
MDNSSAYAIFLQSKHVEVKPSGFDVAIDDLNPLMFKFQKDITRWALKLGRAAAFLNVGLGKTFIQLEWAKHVAAHTGGKVLILAPLAVADQTVREGAKFGIAVKHALQQADVGDASITVTNYDRVHLFDPSQFIGIVLDESGILKHYSKTFFSLAETFETTPYKLCCTATPAPNDFVELGNHAYFLNIMHFKDMLARWFVGEGDVARKARLKHHARADFWRWLTSWSVCISKPSDLGPQYDMDGYDLPQMHVHEYRLAAPQASIDRAQAKGQLLPDGSTSATQFHTVKRESLEARVAQAVEIVAGIPESDPVILWCHTDYEADALKKAFPGVVEVRGSQTPQKKEETLRAFTEGKERLIITKPSIAGMGLNWQHCNQAVYVGVDFSFETTFQSMGRIHRFGQARETHFHICYTDTESDILQTLKRKQDDFEEMQNEMKAAIQEHGLFRDESAPTFSKALSAKEEGKDWTFYLGDCIQVMPTMEAGSVDLTITSIPFSNLYIYSDSEADVGNAADKAEFFQHMEFVIKELLRITRPGRCCAVHVKDLPLFQNRDGEMGVDPFSDDVSAAFRRGGWTLQSRVTVEKDPVIEMQKTNSHGLLFMNWKGRAELLRVGLPDYVLIFQKPGDDKERRVTHDPDDTTYYGDNPPSAGQWLNLPTKGKGANNYSLPVWQKYANPNWSDVVVPLVWTDINQTDVLNYLVAKGDKDERHICPLQLDLIARIIHWKSNPGDVVFDPFGGIASTPYKALEMGRKGVAVELKEDYHKLGVKYLKAVELQKSQKTLWDVIAEKEADTAALEPVSGLKQPLEKEPAL